MSKTHCFGKIQWESGPRISQEEFRDQLWESHPSAKLLESAEDMIKKITQALASGNLPDDEPMSEAARKRFQGYLEQYQAEEVQLLREKEALLDDQTLPTGTFRIALQKPWPPDDIFLQVPKLRIEKKHLIVSTAPGAAGIQAPSRLVHPEVQCAPPHAGIDTPRFEGNRRIRRGILGGGHTSWEIDTEADALLASAMGRWIEIDRPGPLHPMTVACLLTSPPTRTWYTAAITIAQDWESQEQHLREFFKTHHRGWKERRDADPIRPGALDVGRHVFVYVAKTLEHKTWDEVESALWERGYQVDRRTIIRNHNRVLDRLRKAVWDRCDQILKDAAKAHVEFVPYLARGTELTDAWTLGPGRSLIRAGGGTESPS